MAALDLGAIASLATAVAVVVAVVFGIVQVRLQAAQRRDLATMEMLRGMLTREFAEALDRVFSLPDGARPEDVRADAELRKAILLIDFTFESAGVMIHDRLLDLHETDKLMGGLVRIVWRKLGPFIEDERRLQGSPSRGEWMQWLAEQLHEHPVPWKAQGAHVAFRGWRP